MMTDAGPPFAIRETSEGDLPALVALWNDGRVMRWVGHPDGLGIDERGALAWLGRLRLDPDRHHFVAVTDDLGFVGELYYRVEPRHRRAGLDIKLLPEAQGRGLATAGLRALCERAFAEPDVDVVWVEPSRENARARRLYIRCGFAPAERPADLPPGESYWELRRPGR